MNLNTRSLLAAVAVSTAAAGSAQAQLQFEEFLVGGTSGANDFFEISVGNASDIGVGSEAALVVIDSGGTINSVLDFQIDFSLASNTFPTNNLFLVQGGAVSTNQPGTITDVNNPFAATRSPNTFLTGGGPDFFGTSDASSTYLLATGFTLLDGGNNGVGVDVDTNNDGVIDNPSVFGTVQDAVTLLDSANNLSAQLADPSVTPAFTGLAYADDFGGIVFDQRFDENIGISPDGPDGFFRFTNGVAATFDVDFGTVDFGFDGSTAFGPDATEEIIYFDANSGNFIDAQIASDQDPNTPGDQSISLNPGEVNNIIFDDVVVPGGDILPDPVPPTPGIVTDNIAFGEDIVQPTGQVIAGTSFENETVSLYNVIDEAALGFDVNGDGDGSDVLIGVVAEALLDNQNGVDLNGDGDFTDIFGSLYVEDGTDSSSDDSPLGGADSASGQTVALLNNSGDQDVSAGLDGEIGTEDDIAFNSIFAQLNSEGGSGDLGYSSAFIDTRSVDFLSGGLSDGDLVGVIDFDFLQVGADVFDGTADGRDGSNAFALSDIDGTFQITFDEVDLTGFENRFFSILVGVENTGYENEDDLVIELEVTTTEGTEVLTVLELLGQSGGLDGVDILGDIVDPEGAEGVFGGLGQILFAIPDNVLTATAILSFGSSSGAENLVFDNLLFTGDAIAALVGGDADGDGDVDSDDFNILAFNFGNEGGFSEGDFDGDGVVDSDDFNILAFNFGFGTDLLLAGEYAAVEAFGATIAVPEPSSLALLGLGGLILARRRRDK
ncbi:MAG: PEP-CTERM sorting domain-containing protein [Planctomycetota bacterium]